MKKTVKNTSKFIFAVGYIVSEIKRRTVSRMFWGRSNFYKNISHFLMLTITVIVTLSGFIYRVKEVSASQTSLDGTSIIGSDDLLTQGGSISTVLKNDTNNLSAIQTNSYTVKPGDTLDSISKQFNVTMDTIRWANPNLISPFSNEIQVGWDLQIPKINGVLYTVKAGQTIDDIIAVTSVNNSESNKSNIIELNELVPPYTLNEGQKIFVPDGNLIQQNIDVEGIPRGVFTNPLANGGCAGYIESRGFTSYHDGVDLALWTGCPVEAVATGTVYYAGWEDLSGYCVKIDHGGGIHSYYYHAKEVYVKVGQRVQQGDVIMYMGTSGNSTGTHLHFTLKKDNVAVDPADYVPF